jgi:hypothetical protein
MQFQSDSGCSHPDIVDSIARQCTKNITSINRRVALFVMSNQAPVSRYSGLMREVKAAKAMAIIFNRSTQIKIKDDINV